MPTKYIVQVVGGNKKDMRVLTSKDLELEKLQEARYKL
jgi:hypothetical protein